MLKTKKKKHENSLMVKGKTNFFFFDYKKEQSVSRSCCSITEGEIRPSIQNWYEIKTLSCTESPPTLWFTSGCCCWYGLQVSLWVSCDILWSAGDSSQHVVIKHHVLCIKWRQHCVNELCQQWRSSMANFLLSTGGALSTNWSGSCGFFEPRLKFRAAQDQRILFCFFIVFFFLFYFKT